MALWLLTILLLRSTPGLAAQPLKANPGNMQRIPLPKMRYVGRESLDQTAGVSGQPANPVKLRIVDDTAPTKSNPDSTEPRSFTVPQLQGKYDLPSLPGTFKGQGLSGGGMTNPVLVPTVAGMPGPGSAPAHAQAPPVAESYDGIGRPLSSVDISVGDMSWKGQPLTSPSTDDMLAARAKPAAMPSASDVPGDTSAPELVAESGVAPAPGNAGDGGVGQMMTDPKYIFATACTGQTLGVYADPTDVRCWYTCLGFGELGARFCCAWNACYDPPQTFFPFGSCRACAPPPPPNPPPPPPPNKPPPPRPPPPSPPPPPPPPPSPPPPPPSPPPPSPPPPPPPPNPPRPPSPPPGAPVNSPSPPPNPPPPSPPPPPPPPLPPSPPPPSPPPPSPPPPPPLITCPLANIPPEAQPVCGDANIIITLYDFLDGSCGWIPALPGTNTPIQTCTTKPFGQNCGSIRGTLYIVYFVRSAGVLLPNTQAYLDGIGFGQLNTIGNLFITRTPDTWPGTIAPVFLPSLVHVTGNLFIQKATDGDPTFPLTALPGLANLRQVGDTVLVVDTLISRPDFASLQCIGGGIGFFGNSQQTTLEGMNNLIEVNYVPIYPSGPTIIIRLPNAMTAPAALAPLSTAANCGGAPPPLLPSITFAGCTNEIASWAALCTFIASGACP